MELSQTALAVMLFCAAPIGICLSIVYRLTDFGRPSRGNAIIVVLQNLKDFAFMIAAAVLTVLLVYYANDGQFRYMAPVGVLVGYFLADKLFSGVVLRIRRVTCRVLLVIVKWTAGLILAPLALVWRATAGKRIEQAQNRAIVQKTQSRASWWTAQASCGFEDFTEAKEWKKKRNNRMRS